MLIGHYAAGFAGRAMKPGARSSPSLGTWFLAVQWLDLVWPFLILTGIEQLRLTGDADPFLKISFTYYPWTHSLVAAVIWAGLFASVYRWRTGNTSGAWWLAGGVFSHWVLDLIVHVPDLPLAPGVSAAVGLGLWRSPTATVIVECLLFIAGVALYARRTQATDAVGRWAFWILGALLIIIYVASLIGPPPPSATAVGASALLLWLLVPWAYWIDRHREARNAAIQKR